MKLLIEIEKRAHDRKFEKLPENLASFLHEFVWTAVEAINNNSYGFGERYISEQVVKANLNLVTRICIMNTGNRMKEMFRVFNSTLVNSQKC